MGFRLAGDRMGRIASLALLLLSLSLGGCGYRLYPQGERIGGDTQKVYVAVFANNTPEANIESVFRNAFIDQFIKGRRFRLVDSEEAADALIEIYNTSGIQSRLAKDFDKAVMTFKKALFVRPADEALYYNMARTYIEAGDWKSADGAMEEGLKSNLDFQEGLRLQAFIRKNLV